MGRRGEEEEMINCAHKLNARPAAKKEGRRRERERPLKTQIGGRRFDVVAAAVAVAVTAANADFFANSFSALETTNKSHLFMTMREKIKSKNFQAIANLNLSFT